MALSHKIAQLSLEMEKEGVTCFTHLVIILTLLEEHDKGFPPLLSTALAEARGITPSAITGHIDRLEKQSIVERIVSFKDRRVKHVCLTSKGLDVARRAKEWLETSS